MAPSSFVKTAEPFVCGGSAATFASCVIHPMDLAKVGHFYPYSPFRQATIRLEVLEESY